MFQSSLGGFFRNTVKDFAQQKQIKVIKQTSCLGVIILGIHLQAATPAPGPVWGDCGPVANGDNRACLSS